MTLGELKVSAEESDYIPPPLADASINGVFHMKKSTLKSLVMALICLELLGNPQLRAAAPHLEDPGAMEHYHHEFYSHSYVDPNYREDSDSPPSGELSKSKKNRKLIKRNADIAIAFGGHRHHRQQEPNGAKAR